MTTAAITTGIGEPMPVVEAQVLASLLQTLGDPTRLRILTALEEACVPVSAIVEATGVRQPTVSHHLRILRDRGLVRGERRGGYVFYCLATEGLSEALEALRPLARPEEGAR
ncbi:ArsR family transcriptional regulator [Saccharomonospora amisosensis]|uniref:ArsR family transcriptional regulator n=1 Tax=Saccharomonospora amisosensis TaxID=1128677 RepID=A0A7X5UQ49_9PSEU|nr:metalloregulator ArsR/SmtB family transcription factor [Saccharomonospora amisosensis]NIJ12106.1 ArsR family transcriptional regulator [Saccharomonospora amisosensis]